GAGCVPPPAGGTGAARGSTTRRLGGDRTSLGPGRGHRRRIGPSGDVRGGGPVSGGRGGRRPGPRSSLRRRQGVVARARARAGGRAAADRGRQARRPAHAPYGGVGGDV